MKIAIVHYWLVNMRGGEKVLEALCELYPDADIITHVYDPEMISDKIRSHTIHTTFISRLPFAKKHYQKYLPLMPLALEQLDMTRYDLIISSESGPAKGVIPGPTAKHICYCHSPMRYIWDMYNSYLHEKGWLTRSLFMFIAHYLRMWDVSSSSRTDLFIANSSFVQKRIERYYRRSSEIVHPPVDIDGFHQSDASGDFYLMVGQLVGYKMVELAVEAFNESGKPLVVIGTGELEDRVRSIANENIKLLGWQSEAVIREHYAECKALIFPGQEDFGIVPVEAMASGRPVIAYGRGGALDTVIDGETGILFEEQTVLSLNSAIDRFERVQNVFNPAVLIEHAKRFHRKEFQEKMSSIVSKVLLN